MKESIKIEHFNEYRKLSIHNQFVEMDGLLDLEQSNIHNFMLRDIKDKTCEILFLNYIQQKRDKAGSVLHHKEIEDKNKPTK